MALSECEVKCSTTDGTPLTDLTKAEGRDFTNAAPKDRDYHNYYGEHIPRGTLMGAPTCTKYIEEFYRRWSSYQGPLLVV